MITYICQRRHSYTIEGFLDCLEPADRERVTLLSYEQLFAARKLPVSHIIFADLDRLKAPQLGHAAKIANVMRSDAPGAKVLNHPARFRQRFGLLDTLWHAGLNPFRAYRLDQRLPDSIRFPVFLRAEDGAAGPISDLIYNRAALEQLIASLPSLGIPLRGHMLVEYCNVKDSDGHFRKYSAFRVEDKILSHHIQWSGGWIVKRDFMNLTPDLIDEELGYVMKNPHEDALMQIFDVAGADFGRIDYGLVNGRIVTFEINSNPTLPRRTARNQRLERHKVILPRLISAFMAIACTPAGSGFVDLPDIDRKAPRA